MGALTRHRPVHRLFFLSRRVPAPGRTHSERHAGEIDERLAAESPAGSRRECRVSDHRLCDHGAVGGQRRGGPRPRTGPDGQDGGDGPSGEFDENREREESSLIPRLLAETSSEVLFIGLFLTAWTGVLLLTFVLQVVWTTVQRRRPGLGRWLGNLG